MHNHNTFGAVTSEVIGNFRWCDFCIAFSSPSSFSFPRCCFFFSPRAHTYTHTECMVVHYLLLHNNFHVASADFKLFFFFCATRETGVYCATNTSNAREPNRTNHDKRRQNGSSVLFFYFFFFCGWITITHFCHFRFILNKISFDSMSTRERPKPCMLAMPSLRSHYFQILFSITAITPWTDWHPEAIVYVASVAWTATECRLDSLPVRFLSYRVVMCLCLCMPLHSNDFVLVNASRLLSTEKIMTQRNETNENLTISYSLFHSVYSERRTISFHWKVNISNDSFFFLHSFLKWFRDFLWPVRPCRFCDRKIEEQQ